MTKNDKKSTAGLCIASTPTLYYYYEIKVDKVEALKPYLCN